MISDNILSIVTKRCKSGTQLSGWNLNEFAFNAKTKTADNGRLVVRDLFQKIHDFLLPYISGSSCDFDYVARLIFRAFLIDDLKHENNSKYNLYLGYNFNIQI